MADKISKRIFDEIGHNVSGFVKEQIERLDDLHAPEANTQKDPDISKLRKENEELKAKVKEAEAARAKAEQNLTDILEAQETQEDDDVK